MLGIAITVEERESIKEKQRIHELEGPLETHEKLCLLTDGETGGPVTYTLAQTS